MSQAGNLAVDTFTTRAKGAYQSGSKLRGKVRMATGVRGKSHTFNVIGKGVARKRSSLEPVAFANLGNSKPIAHLEYRDMWEPLSEMDAAELTVDYAGQIGDAVGYGVARSIDGDIIGALSPFFTDTGTGNQAAVDARRNTAFTAAATQQGTFVPSGITGVTQTIQTTGNFPTAKELSEGTAKLMNAGVMKREDITLALGWELFPELADQEELSSNDYIQGNRVTQEAALSRVYGFNVVFFDRGARENQRDGDLPDNRGLMFARSAVGLATNRERVGIREWRPDIQGWQFGAWAMCGAVVIDAAGIVGYDFS